MSLLETVRAFIAFGRPKEGSDRSKAAWDAMKAAADAAGVPVRVPPALDLPTDKRLTGD